MTPDQLTAATVKAVNSIKRYLDEIQVYTPGSFEVKAGILIRRNFNELWEEAEQKLNEPTIQPSDITNPSPIANVPSAAPGGSLRKILQEFQRDRTNP